MIIVLQEKLMTSSYSPVLTTKAVKDETEQRILRDAHVRHLHSDTQTRAQTSTEALVIIYDAELVQM